MVRIHDISISYSLPPNSWSRVLETLLFQATNLWKISFVLKIGHKPQYFFKYFFSQKYFMPQRISLHKFYISQVSHASAHFGSQSVLFLKIFHFSKVFSFFKRQVTITNMEQSHEQAQWQVKFSSRASLYNNSVIIWSHLVVNNIRTINYLTPISKRDSAKSTLIAETIPEHF